MDWLTKQKTYVGIIIFLVAINLTAIILLWVGRPGPPPMYKNGRPDTNNFLKNELGLNNDQEKKFKLLRQTLFDSIDVINKQIWVKKLEIQKQAFKENPDTLKVNKLLQEIVNYQIHNEKLMFNHFSALRNILAPDQLDKFNKIISQPDKITPPPHDRNHQNPPPPGEFPPPGR
jgi:Spy/CpxP family protein refolding chaperone